MNILPIAAFFSLFIACQGQDSNSHISEDASAEKTIMGTPTMAEEFTDIWFKKAADSSNLELAEANEQFATSFLLRGGHRLDSIGAGFPGEDVKTAGGVRGHENSAVVSAGGKVTNIAIWSCATLIKGLDGLSSFDRTRHESICQVELHIEGRDSNNTIIKKKLTAGNENLGKNQNTNWKLGKHESTDGIAGLRVYANKNDRAEIDAIGIIDITGELISFNNIGSDNIEETPKSKNSTTKTKQVAPLNIDDKLEQVSIRVNDNAIISMTFHWSNNNSVVTDLNKYGSTSTTPKLGINESFQKADVYLCSTRRSHGENRICAIKFTVQSEQGYKYVVADTSNSRSWGVNLENDANVDWEKKGVTKVEVDLSTKNFKIEQLIGGMEEIISFTN